MRYKPRLTATALSLWLGFSAGAYAAEETKAEEKDQPQAAGEKTLTVKPEDLQIDVTVDGVFEASDVAEISVATDTWAELTVQSAVNHGQRVKKGAKLLVLDMRKIDIAIADLEAEIEGSQLALKQSEAALDLLRKSVPQSLEAARRAATEAAENLARFRQIERADSIKDMDLDVIQTRRALDYQNEELRQLEKMYKADDLTEETEEIILTRARHRVEIYKHMLARAITGQEKFRKVTLPRREADFEQAARQTQLALEEAQANLPPSLPAKTLAVEKQKTALKRSRQKLVRLRSDRKAMTVLAPSAGIVYYGQAVQGKWPTAATIAKQLSRGSLVKPNQVVMSIVNSSNAFVRATLDEKDLSRVKKGAAAQVKPAAFSDLRLNGKVTAVSPIPIAEGKFGLKVELAAGQPLKQIAAGMACKVTMDIVSKPAAILVPKSAVKVHNKARRGHVYVLTSDDPPEKRIVFLGILHDGRWEIVEGLKEGDQVLITNPDSDDPDKKTTQTP